MSVSLTPMTIAVLLRDGKPIASLPVTEPENERLVALVIAKLCQQSDDAGQAHSHVELRRRGHLVEAFTSTRLVLA